MAEYSPGTVRVWHGKWQGMINVREREGKPWKRKTKVPRTYHEPDPEHIGIATLFCTGLLETKEERLREHELDCEAYHRAVLRFASVYLEGHELHALADVALAVPKAHAVRPALAADLGADRLSEIMGRTRWFWHAEHSDDLARLFDGVDGDEASLITEAGMHICSPLIEEYALDGFLEMAGDDDLESLRHAVQEVMEARGLA